MLDDVSGQCLLLPRLYCSIICSPDSPPFCFFVVSDSCLFAGILCEYPWITEPIFNAPTPLPWCIPLDTDLGPTGLGPTLPFVAWKALCSVGGVCKSATPWHNPSLAQQVVLPAPHDAWGQWQVAALWWLFSPQPLLSPGSVPDPSHPGLLCWASWCSCIFKDRFHLQVPPNTSAPQRCAKLQLPLLSASGSSCRWCSACTIQVIPSNSSWTASSRDSHLSQSTLMTLWLLAPHSMSMNLTLDSPSTGSYSRLIVRPKKCTFAQSGISFFSAAETFHSIVNTYDQWKKKCLGWPQWNVQSFTFIALFVCFYLRAIECTFEMHLWTYTTWIR